MKKLFYIFLTLLIISTGCEENSNAVRPALTGDVKKDIHNLLPEGNHTADIMNKLTKNPRLEELSAKLMQAYQLQPEWFAEYRRNSPKGPLPYHTNLGMTEEEYAEYLNLTNDIKVVSSGTAEFNIINEGNLIKFKAKGFNLIFLNEIIINLDSNTVRVAGYTLKYNHEVSVTDSTNALRSAWKGYSWRCEYPEKIETYSLQELSNMDIIYYDFTVGRLDKNGKTFMTIKGRKVIEGQETVNFEIPLMF